MNKQRILILIISAVVSFVLALTVGATHAVSLSLSVAAGCLGGVIIILLADERLGVAQYAWRLVPANPILLRVVDSGGKRLRDMIFRCIYLGLLIGIVIVMLVTSSQDIGTSDLSALAKSSARIFQAMSYGQLALVALLSPIFTAGAITQEKDSQTYDILLSTPLTNGQIVLGSLLSRLFFVVALLISGIPIFSITQIFGGVAIKSIALSFALAAATAFITGALAMAIATFKVGTRRTIFSFYLFIVLYMAGGMFLDQVGYFQVGGHFDPQRGITSRISWFTGLNPFLALRVLFNDPTYGPPTYEELPANLRFWPVSWYLTNPTAFYIGFMFLITFLMVTPSIVLLRRMAQSTTSLKTFFLQKLKISTGDKTRKPRGVWANPIAWREAKTKASAAKATVLRFGFIALGLVVAFVMLVRFMTVQTPASTVSGGSFDPVQRTIDIDGKTYYITATEPPPNPYGQQMEGTHVRLQKDTLDASGKPELGPFDIDKLKGSMEVVSKLTIEKQRADSGTTPTPPPNIYVPPGSRRTTAGGAGGVTQFGGGHTEKDTLAELVLRPIPRALQPSDARKYLLGLAVVEFAVILLIVTNAAASTVTREKEDGTLDLLLSSPITSRYYIWGKLRGLVYFVLPLVAVPVASAAMFVLYDVVRRLGSWDDPNFEWVVLPESIVLLPLMLIIVSAFAAILGMQMSLRCRTTVMAVMSSVGIILGICGAMGACGWKLVSPDSGGGGFFPLAAGSFSPFTLMQMLIAPNTTSVDTFKEITDPEMSGRLEIIFFTLVAVGAYTAVVWSMYTSMVKNFDMTIRKQSR